jgi:GrpB-like predicted nucleotidyltransferase (UPF0157 family)
MTTIPVESRSEVLTCSANAGLGLAAGDVKLVDYNDSWPRAFALAREELKSALGPIDSRIVHFGSTAIPGCAAKPILDLAIAVKDQSTALRIVPQLKGLGYGNRWIHMLPDRICLPRGTPVTHHLYVVVEGSSTLLAWETFCERLMKDDRLRHEYIRTKQRVAAAHPKNRMAYTAGKADFVARVIKFEVQYDK